MRKFNYVLSRLQYETFKSNGNTIQDFVEEVITNRLRAENYVVENFSHQEIHTNDDFDELRNAFKSRLTVSEVRQRITDFWDLFAILEKADDKYVVTVYITRINMCGECMHFSAGLCMLFSKQQNSTHSCSCFIVRRRDR